MTVLSLADQPAAAWTDVGTFLTGVAALLISIGALVVAIWTGKHNRRNADAAESSATAAKDSAASSARSADAAEQAVTSANGILDIERKRQHDAYRPLQPDSPRFELIRSEHAGQLDLCFVFSLPRSYRVLGDKIERNARTTLSVDRLTLGGSTQRVHVETLPPGRVQPLAGELHLRFWPPSPEVDEVELWTCPCGLPTHEGEVPHWEWNVTVVSPPSLSQQHA
ncbi:hypothetical protein AB0J68_00285 [Micromonospora sp. NPDC049580]|uniref:hypothetical protein n=1 Tax=Micromonospora sp. NPDC049580 TaxID=3154832 RepID=UPI003425AB0C